MYLSGRNNNVKEGMSPAGMVLDVVVGVSLDERRVIITRGELGGCEIEGELEVFLGMRSLGREGSAIGEVLDWAIDSVGKNGESRGDRSSVHGGSGDEEGGEDDGGDHVGIYKREVVDVRVRRCG